MENRYEPRIGETVRVEFYGVVERVERTPFSKDQAQTTLNVKLNEYGDMAYVVGVPLVCIEPFKPLEDAEKADASHDEPRLPW